MLLFCALVLMIVAIIIIIYWTNLVCMLSEARHYDIVTLTAVVFHQMSASCFILYLRRQLPIAMSFISYSWMCHFENALSVLTLAFLCKQAAAISFTSPSPRFLFVFHLPCSLPNLWLSLSLQNCHFSSECWFAQSIALISTNARFHSQKGAAPQLLIKRRIVLAKGRSFIRNNENTVKSACSHQFCDVTKYPGILGHVR